MNNDFSTVLAIGTLAAVSAAATPIAAQPSPVRDVPIVGDYFCTSIHTLSTDGLWQEVEGSFAIEVADTGAVTSDAGTTQTYRYSATSDEFGDLVLEEGDASSTGFSWVYAFYGEDETLYEIEDMWDGDTYLKVFDPFGTNILDAHCTAAS